MQVFVRNAVHTRAYPICCPGCSAPEAELSDTDLWRLILKSPQEPKPEPQLTQEREPRPQLEQEVVPYWSMPPSARPPAPAPAPAAQQATTPQVTWEQHVERFTEFDMPRKGYVRCRNCNDNTWLLRDSDGLANCTHCGIFCARCFLSPAHLGRSCNVAGIEHRAEALRPQIAAADDQLRAALANAIGALAGADANWERVFGLLPFVNQPANVNAVAAALLAAMPRISALAGESMVALNGLYDCEDGALVFPQVIQVPQAVVATLWHFVDAIEAVPGLINARITLQAEAEAITALIQRLRNLGKGKGREVQGVELGNQVEQELNGLVYILAHLLLAPARLQAVVVEEPAAAVAVIQNVQEVPVVEEPVKDTEMQDAGLEYPPSQTGSIKRSPDEVEEEPQVVKRARLEDEGEDAGCSEDRCAEQELDREALHLAAPVPFVMPNPSQINFPDFPPFGMHQFPAPAPARRQIPVHLQEALQAARAAVDNANRLIDRNDGMRNRRLLRDLEDARHAIDRYLGNDQDPEVGREWRRRHAFQGLDFNDGDEFYGGGFGQMPRAAPVADVVFDPAKPDQAVQTMAAREGWKPCPQCGVTVEKVGGCNTVNWYVFALFCRRILHSLIFFPLLLFSQSHVPHDFLLGLQQHPARWSPLLVHREEAWRPQPPPRCLRHVEHGKKWKRE